MKLNTDLNAVLFKIVVGSVLTTIVTIFLPDIVYAHGEVMSVEIEKAGYIKIIAGVVIIISISTLTWYKFCKKK